MYGIGCTGIDAEEEYNIHVAYRKILKYNFHLSLRLLISELLEVLHINSIHNML